MKISMIIVLLLFLFVISCSKEKDQNATLKETDTITINNFKFEPQGVSVPIGKTVTWKQEDSAPHSVISPLFESKILNNGDTFIYTFTKQGEYTYHCGIHPSMIGKIIVK